MNISIVICCYNSASRIEPTLKALSSQETQVKWEIILVNNNSTDNTKEISERTWKALKNKTPLKIVDEVSPGLSSARKTGVLNASGELIIFCDDDNHLDSDYLNNAYHIMTKDDTLGALCGKNTPIFFGPKDPIINSFINAFACGELHSESTYLKGKISPWGAGLVVRSKFMKTLYNELNFSSILSDRKGNALSSGGDTEFCYLIKLAGFTWRYDTSLHLYHELPSNRLTYSYLKKLRYSQGKALVSIDWYYKFGDSKRFKTKNSSWIKIFLSQLFHLFTHSLSIPNSREKRLKNLYHLGYISQLWKERRNFRYNELYVKDIIGKILSTKKTIIALDTVFLDKPHSGISIVWKTILDNISVEKYDLVLLKRKNSIIPNNILNKHKIIEIDSFNYANMEKDVDYLNHICKTYFIDFFISTYYTYTTNTPCIVYLHDMIAEIFKYDFRKPMWNQKKLCIKNSNCFIAISQNTSYDFKKFYPLKPKPILVYNALDTKRLSEKDPKILKELNISKPFFVILPTNNNEYKNINLIKRMFNRYPEIFNDFDFVSFKDTLSEYPVKIKTNIPDDQLTALISKSQAIIYPSLYEGFGLPILEGFYLETHVVTCYNSAIKEVGQNACVYVDEVNEEDLKNKLYHIFEGKYLDKIKIGKMIINQFNIKRQSESFNKALEYFISNQKKQ